MADDPVRNSPDAIVTRIAYEQFPYQESLFEEVSRSHALLVEGLSDVRTEVLTEAAWEEVLGAPLRFAVGATFLLFVGAMQNLGEYNPSWLDQPNFTEILEVWPRQSIEVTARRLTASFEAFRRDYQAQPQPIPELARFGYNPLVRTPFIEVGEKVVAPQPQLILRTISPGGLYYVGANRWGDAFTRDMGRLVEHYVGRQLRLARPAEVYGEITYGRPEQRSVDWFLVLDDLVVLVEVKSTRLGLTARAGDDSLIPQLQRCLDRAVRQIERSVERIKAGDSAFQHIPADRPLVGLVVTAEPYYVANSLTVRRHLREAPIPTLTASLRDLEHLMSGPTETLARQLAAIATDPERSSWNLGVALANVAKPMRNPILDSAWASYRWP